jgi:hypothetical protein
MSSTEIALSTAPLEAHDIGSIVVNSFRFSRGNALCQEALLGFIATNFKSQFNPDTFQEALRQSQNKVWKAFSQHHGVRPATGESTVRSEAEKFTELLYDRSQAQPTASKVTSELIYSDYMWLPRIRHVEGKQPLPQPYHSNIATYGFLGKNIGRPEFRAIFNFAADAILAELPSPADMRQITEVIATHYQAQNTDRKALQERLAGTVLEAA